jgi:hypothetical protein
MPSIHSRIKCKARAQIFGPGGDAFEWGPDPRITVVRGSRAARPETGWKPILHWAPEGRAMSHGQPGQHLRGPA